MALKIPFVYAALNICSLSFSKSYESAEEVFRATADIVKSRAKQNNEEVCSRWEPLFNNLGHCCRKNKKYKEALEYHQYVRSLEKELSPIYAN